MNNTTNNTTNSTINTTIDSIETTTLKENLTSITFKEFVTIWKKISTDQRIKPTLITKKYGNNTFKVKEKGWLFAEHYILYNIVRGLPASRGFQTDSEGFGDALNHINHMSTNYLPSYIFLPFSEHMDKMKFNQILNEIQHLLKT